MKKFVAIALIIMVAFSAGACTSTYKFKYKIEDIESISIHDYFIGEKLPVDETMWADFIKGLNELNYKSYREMLRAKSEHEIYITFKNEERAIIDAFGISERGVFQRYKCNTLDYDNFIWPFLDEEAQERFRKALEDAFLPVPQMNTGSESPIGDLETQKMATI